MIGEYVKMHGRVELLDQLEKDQRLVSQPDAKAGLEEMRLLLHFCSMLGITDRVRCQEWGRREELTTDSFSFRYPLT